MEQYLESLSVTEAEKLKKTVLSLFRQTCILQEKYDPVTLVPSDNEQFAICRTHRNFIENYLSVLGCELLYDSQERIFRLVGEGVEAEVLSKETTIIVLLIKMIYRDKIMGKGLVCDGDEFRRNQRVREEYESLNQKLPDGEWKSALAIMKNIRLWSIRGRFVILRTIHRFIFTARLIYIAVRR
ncbi:MAG: hypothetical protein ACLTUL_20545 [Blautia faecis]